jgi:DNA-binding response OmpR family regulator
MASEKVFHVLVVDNDEPVCEALTEGLEAMGYQAECETDSLTALRAFSENPGRFDLAIIEPVLPGLMGLDLAVRFRHIRPGFPVLFYAGYADESLSHRIEADGFGRVIFKPLTSRELARKIRDALQKKHC